MYVFFFSASILQIEVIEESLLDLDKENCLKMQQYEGMEIESCFCSN